jgi:hypothetical protein
MMSRIRSPNVFAPLFVALGLLLTADPLAAQTGRRWTVVPQLGFGIVTDNSSVGSAGLETGLELENGGAGWRWSGYASIRGIGVGCSESCFDGGPALALGGARSIGPLWLGAGAGAMRLFTRWRTVPFGRISLDVAPVRFDVRIEFPQFAGLGVYVPFLVGVPIPR